jgi:hypothetical protein
MQTLVVAIEYPRLADNRSRLGFRAAVHNQHNQCQGRITEVARAETRSGLAGP